MKFGLAILGLIVSVKASAMEMTCRPVELARGPISISINTDSQQISSIRDVLHYEGADSKPRDYIITLRERSAQGSMLALVAVGYTGEWSYGTRYTVLIPNDLEERAQRGIAPVFTTKLKVDPYPNKGQPFDVRCERSK